MTDFVKDSVPAEEMIRPRTSPRRALRAPALAGCVVPEIVFGRPGETI